MTRRRVCILIGASIALIATGVFAATRLTKADPDDVVNEAVDREGAEMTTDLWISEIKPANVETTTVAWESLSEWVTAHGLTAPDYDVTYSAEVPGRLEHLGAALGQAVRKGQVLVRIDVDGLKAQKNKAEANWALAKTTYGRLDALGADLVSSQKLDEARYGLSSAKAEFAMAKDNLDKSAVRARHGGVVSAKYVEEGEYVSPGTPLFRVVDHRTIIVEAQLPETQIASVKTGAEAGIRVDALNRSYTGKVEAVLPAADIASKMFTVRVRVDNRDLEILAGMSAIMRARIAVHRDVVVVPRDVVIEGNGKSRVFVNALGKAEERVVELGASEGDRVVVLEGLCPGDELIITGHRNLIDGQPINLIR